jgi:hypothetical protein
VAWVVTSDLNVPIGWRVKVTQRFTARELMVHVEGPGIDRRVFLRCIDFGIELLTARGHWIPDSDWRSRRWLWRVRKALDTGRIPSGAEGLTIERIDQVLVRWQRQ